MSYKNNAENIVKWSCEYAENIVRSSCEYNYTLLFFCEEMLQLSDIYTVF